ncbi:MAG: DUF1616 domain-containing protein [Dehalococcoidia bacterium]|nr:MAG: DUF1616 domain-containing protein [Dehalococcoidia bacterium]
MNKTLSISLAIAILVAVACIGYIIAIPTQSGKFTEFYILNTEGKAENYQAHVTIGKPIAVIIGIVNNEYAPISYRVVITVDGIKNKEINIGGLAHQEKWQETVSFTLNKVGDNRKVEFWLYKNGEIEPYLKDPLRLFIDVIKPY